MKEINIDGIFIKDFGGEGVPLIFNHAFPLCNRMWDNQVEYFKGKHRVIIYDTRGLGYSTNIPSSFYTMEDLADDLIMIMDELRIEKANICGLSMGGYIALRSLTRNTERFNSVILADTRSSAEDNASLLNRSNVIKTVRNGGKLHFKMDFTKKLLNQKHYEDDKLRSFVETMIEWQKPEGICSAVVAMTTRLDTTEMLKDVSVPGLILCGEDDELTPFHFSESMHRALKNSRIEKVPSSGHLTNMENPGFFNNTIENFLNEIS